MHWVAADPVTKSQRVTNSSGAVESTVDLDPWGGEISKSANQAFEPHRYTSYERDGNASDEAMQRRYQGYWHRFNQPDPYRGSYDLSDPQSFNRYSYTQNDPVNFVDPSGLAESWNFCSAQYSFEECGGASGFWGGEFGGHVAEFNRLYEGIPEHARESYTRYLAGVNPRAFSRWLPAGAHYVGDLVWGYSEQRGDQYFVYSFTLTYDRLTNLIFDNYYGYGWRIGGNFRDVYGGLRDVSGGLQTDMNAQMAIGGLLNGLRGLIGAGLSGLRSLLARESVSFDWSRAGHIFRDAAGHVNPASATSQARYAEIFERVASNPANLRTGYPLPPGAAAAGIRVYTQIFRNGQVWVWVRNGVIQNAGINAVGAFR